MRIQKFSILIERTKFIHSLKPAVIQSKSKNQFTNNTSTSINTEMPKTPKNRCKKSFIISLFDFTNMESVKF